MTERPTGTAPCGSEEERLAALARYDILDTPRERDFDDIAELASEICGTPIAVVNLVGDGRQWFKAEVGLGVRETPLETSFCGHAILQDDFMLVPDATRDPRFERNPLVAGAPGLRFYAGALLKTAEGLPIGTLCVLDYEPRALSDRQVRTLKRLARQVMTQLELRRALKAQDVQVAERTRERDGVWMLVPDLLMAGSLDGRLLAVNPAWTRVLGYTEAELLARPLRELVDPDFADASAEAVGRMRRGETVRHTNRLRTAAGAYRWFDWVSAPVGDVFYAVARDVTERKERQTELEAAQDALRQAQKMEAVGQLTGGVAHDFNNLLTIVRSSVDLLRRPGLAEERRRRYVDAIADTVDRAGRLTGQLLAFARRQALSPEVFDAAERVRGVIDMVRTIAGSRVRVVADLAPGPCLVEADASQFETALVNMAVNARDAMDGEGTLTLRVGEVAGLPPVRGHAGHPGRFVAVSLADTGCGIPPGQLARIFEPFFTTKEVGKGTGLGLSQVYGFAKQSGGDVDVVGGAAGGTTFVLYLPRVEPKAEGAARRDAAAAPAPAAAEDGHGRRVLVVEDDVEVGRFSTELLQDLGYETVWAADAGQALALLADSGGRRFDVVFTDVVMPGMSGVDLGREIRRRHPGLPVVLTSGYSHVLAEEGGRHGFELLRKPYAVEELSRVLRRVARGRGYLPSGGA